jgi:nucleotide-binding universal stress UspA family protein
MIKLNKILCPTDLSKNAAHALPYAVELAKTYGATLYLLHVVDAYWLESTAIAQLPDYTGKSLYNPTQTAMGELKIIKEGIKDVEIETAEIFGTPYVEIVRFARQEGIS